MSEVVTGPRLIGEIALVEARKHDGVKEDPPNSNLQMFGAWYGANGVKWCGQYVSHAFLVGAGYEICKGFKGPGVKDGRGCAYVPTIEAWLRHMNFAIDRSEEPCPGDIVIYDWNSDGAPEHVGIVDVSMGRGKFKAWEGNTSIGDDSNGGAVMCRLRLATQVKCFGRIIG